MLMIFDVVGTIFSLERIGQIMKEQGLPPGLLSLWFARLLQTAMAATLAGRYLPFTQAAEASLKQILTAAGCSEKLAEPVLKGLKEISPWPDAAGCLEELRGAGHRLAALSNSSAEATNGLLEKADLSNHFEQVFSTDEVRACKPDPRPYRRALERCGCEPGAACMVAAHGWDILGADAVGMQTVWIERLEKRWPFPAVPPGRVAKALAEVPNVLKATR